MPLPAAAVIGTDINFTGTDNTNGGTKVETYIGFILEDGRGVAIHSFAKRLRI